MIRLNKGAKPQVLINHAEEWTRELLASIQRGDGTYDELVKNYNKPAIKQALETETNGKCMYCEGRIKALGYNQIEHFKPKDKVRYPELTFDWDNLGIACNVCNVNKGEDFDEAVPYINPYAEDPSAHFVAAGALVFPKPGDVRAKLTHLTIKLNRKDLVEVRGDALIEMHRLITDYHTEQRPALKGALRDQIWLECGSREQFSFVLKVFAELADVPAN